MRISEIDPKANLPTAQYSFAEKPTAPKPPKAPTASKAPVKPKAKMIKPLSPDKAMVASLQQKIQTMRDRLKAVRQSQKQTR
jgi:hypothetical protein